MGTSDTGSSFDQWSTGIYRYEGAPLGHADSSGATTTGSKGVVTTAAAAAVASPTSAGSGDGSPSRMTRDLIGTQGPRVGKPASAARKRSRASRRAPVTLLNTDTANFRAMVQQFTGIPAPSPFATPGGVPVISFASDYGFPPPAGVMSFDQVHSHLQRQPTTFHDQLLHRPQHQQQYTGGPFGYSSSLQDLAGDAFGHGLGSAEDRMLLQSMQQAAQMPAASTANNTVNGYFA